jgi:3-dehydroquinate synthase II
MKQLWVRLNPQASAEDKTKLLTIAQDHCNAALLSPQDIPLASTLKIRTASTDLRAEIRILSDEAPPSRSETSTPFAVEVVVKDRSDEQRALEFVDKGASYLIVRCPDWKIIPLENLIAHTRNRATLLADTANIAEAKIALQTLEMGVDGVVISPRTPSDIEALSSFLKHLEDTVSLAKGRIVSVKPIGLGARVCVDTCELMKAGEGMLVGSQSSGLFLIEAEVHKNPHVEPRPFRVNAGPVSSYVLTPGHKTRYLSELKAGDEVLIVNRSGVARSGHVGRVKIERRPMSVIETEAGGISYALIVQNAETVRLMTDGSSKSVSELKPNDEVLLRVETGGRHFGTLVADEMVIER